MADRETRFIKWSDGTVSFLSEVIVRFWPKADLQKTSG